jgi:hypothetical protein
LLDLLVVMKNTPKPIKPIFLRRQPRGKANRNK